MRRALQLAERARGATSPNPMVGAVLVDQNGALIAEGWHAGPGEPHAEVVALEKAGPAAAGATLYVTLEPCCHWGRTGPCTERIIAAGVRRVVAAVVDPNPRVSGKGFSRLAEAGIRVESGLLAREARLLNKGFFTWIVHGRPYVYAKIAQSLDGKVATRTGESRWITTEAARQDAHALRATVDAIAVGIGTVLADNPRLTARPPGPGGRQPLRVIVDSRCRTPLDAACLKEPGATLIATTPRAPHSRRRALERAGAQVWVDERAGQTVGIERLLRHLGTLNVTSLLVEGGPTLLGSFRDEDLIDEYWVYIAPRVIGGLKAPSAMGGVGSAALHDAQPLLDPTLTPVGPDFKFTGRVRRSHVDGEEA